MGGDRDDAARRFVHLVDELYDNQVNLVCTADAGPMGLYTGERLVAAFERTASRLVEMQSADYLAGAHRAERSGTPVPGGGHGMNGMA